MIIDCHGHYTTAPSAARGAGAPADRGASGPPQPAPPRSKISDDEIREHRGRPAQDAARARHRSDDLLAARRRHGSPHRRRDHQRTWAAICNELCFRVCKLFPENFIGAAMLPQSARRRSRRTVFPSSSAASRNTASSASISTPIRPGGRWTSPPLTDRYWYPIYEKMVECDMPAMVHVCAPAAIRASTPPARITSTATPTAFMQLIQGDLFKDFPTLQLHHPAWRRRRAVSLGPLSRARAGNEEAGC